MIQKTLKSKIAFPDMDAAKNALIRKGFSICEVAGTTTATLPILGKCLVKKAELVPCTSGVYLSLSTQLMH